MADVNGFVAYPSIPPAIGSTIEAALRELRERSGLTGLSSWREADIAGHFIRTEILQQIAERDCLVADVTRLNFNVTYEVGYAIGLKKRVLLVRNSAFHPSAPSISEVGIFDTLGHLTYENSSELATLLRQASSANPIAIPAVALNRKLPIYLTESKFKTDAATRIVARLKKKARLGFRSFDPNEQPRLSGPDAISNIAESFGVLVHLLPSVAADHDVHNLRAAFIAGLAAGMNKECLLLQQGDEPVPLDYRDLVVAFFHPEQIDDAIAEFAGGVAEAFQASAEPAVPEAETLLQRVTLGASSAENEVRDLAAYYLEIDAFRRALRGEVRMVVGRKGSGKSAIFQRVRDKVRSAKDNVVLDLRPEGYKLIKFKEEVLDVLSEGTSEHTITAFWEYLLLLEVCHKILEKDRVPHTRDQRLYAPYRALSELYQADEYVGEGDFSERMSELLRHIGQEFHRQFGERDGNLRLTASQITQLIYVHDVPRLRQRVYDYLKLKDSLWLLFDNLDKGWPTHGLRGEDLIIVRALLEATRKLERQLRTDDFDCRTLVFLRNDVYELLVGETSDRGKETKVLLDWTDPDLLRELLRRRFLFGSGLPDTSSFDDVWRAIAISHVGGEESSQFVIDRCLMRPRALLDLLGHCRSIAINLRHQRIEQEDFVKGLQAFSTDLLSEINLEIRDILPAAENVVYEFIGEKAMLPAAELDAILEKVSASAPERDAFAELLLWYGVLGVVRLDGDVSYIYSVNYDMARLRGIISKLSETGLVYAINPGFAAALESR